MKTGHLPLCLGVLFLTCALNAQIATGAPPFSSTTGGTDTIDLGNLNVHIDFPILSHAGRGLPLHYSWSYDNSIWYPSGSAWIPVTNWGWRSQTEAAVGYITYVQNQTKCFDEPPGFYFAPTVGQFVYHDGAGTPHGFAIHWTFCGNDNNPHSGIASDGSGMFLNADTNVVTLKSGTTITAPSQSNTGSGTVKDSNGNFISVTPTSITDTLGSSALTITGSTSPTQFTYTGPQGAQNVVIGYTVFNIKTNFACSGIAEYTGSNISLPTSIRLPDTTQYTIAYEPTPGFSGYYTGRIKTLTLPTGGTITYSYTGANDGTSCSDGSTLRLTKVTPDTGGNSWQYTRTQAGANWQTLVQDPVGNQTLATFNGIYELQRKVYTGSTTSGTLLATIDTCYDGATPDASGTCLTTIPVPPFTQVDNYKRLPSLTGANSRSTAVYDAVYTRLTETDEYDFGALNSGVGPLIRKKSITYASLGNNIQDRPSAVYICNTATCDAGHAISQTTYSYDSGTLQSTTGTPQHSAISGSRGNATQVTSLGQGGVNLSRSFAYYDTGGIYTATDVNGAVTTYTFSDSTSSCGNSFPTNVQLPLSLTRAASWNCSGAVQTGATDENGKSTSVTYNDPHYWRATASTDQLNNQTNYSYTTIPAFSIESSFSFNAGNSVIDQLTTLDPMGRPHVTQQRQGPTSSTYDSVETDYDALGRAFRGSLPYAGTSGQSAGTKFVTTTFDGVGRTTQVTDAGNGYTSYDYVTNGKYNDLLIAVGPAPTGEGLKQRQLEYDGAGRLASVCEVTSMSGSSACGQKNSKTGFLTTYTYDVLDNMTQVVQHGSGTSQTRTYVYDGIGRMTSETNPESGTTTYVYDITTVADTCGSIGRTSPGDLVQKKDANGVLTCYIYDSLHRVTDVGNTSGNGTSNPCKRFRYDNSNGVTGTRPTGVTISNSLGRLVEAETDNCGAWPPTPIVDEWFGYSPRGEITDTYEKTTNSAGYHHFNVTYWPHGVPNTVKGWLPNGTLDYQYNNLVDAEGRISSVRDGSGGNILTSVTYTTTGTSQPIGSLTGMTFGSGDSDSYSYDVNTGRMTQYTFAVNGATDQGTLTWNANGTLRSLAIADSINPADSQTCNYGTTSVPGYDDLGRLVSVSCGSPWSQSFSYDPFGNITKSGSISWNPGYASSTNRYNLVGTSYDNNGQLLNDTFHSYTWSVFGTPMTMDSVGFVYDALDREVEINNGSTHYQIIYSPVNNARLTAQGNSSPYETVPLLMGAFSQWNNGVEHYSHADWLGSLRESSSTSRTSLGNTAYAPFGERYSTSGSPDQVFAAIPDFYITGTYDASYRKYNSNQGRWISPDPAGMAAGDPMNPQSWNRYEYVNNVPTMAIDPMGLLPCEGRCVWGGGGGGGFFGDCLSCGGGLNPALGPGEILDNWGNPVSGATAQLAISTGAGAICTQCQRGDTIDANYNIWGWADPGTGVAAPLCGFVPCTTRNGPTVITPGNIQLLAYWGIIGTANDPHSPLCFLFCGSNGDVVFNRTYGASQMATITSTRLTRPTKEQFIAACSDYAIISNNVFDVGASQAASLGSGIVFQQYTQYSRPTTMNPSSSSIALLGPLSAPGIGVAAAYNNCMAAFPKP